MSARPDLPDAWRSFSDFFILQGLVFLLSFVLMLSVQHRILRSAMRSAASAANASSAEPPIAVALDATGTLSMAGRPIGASVDPGAEASLRAALAERGTKRVIELQVAGDARAQTIAAAWDLIDKLDAELVFGLAASKE